MAQCRTSTGAAGCGRPCQPHAPQVPRQVTSVDQAGCAAARWRGKAGQTVNHHPSPFLQADQGCDFDFLKAK